MRIVLSIKLRKTSLTLIRSSFINSVHSLSAVKVPNRRMEDAESDFEVRLNHTHLFLFSDDACIPRRFVLVWGKEKKSCVGVNWE